MKKLRILLLLSLMLLLVGCGNKVDKEKDNPESENNIGEDLSDKTGDKGNDAKDTESFIFEYQGVSVIMNQKADETIDALGEPMEYFEEPSCAFQGLDKIYYYSGFELSTYPMEEEDFISTITFYDDSVATKEGIYLGDELEKVLEAYGNDYTEESGQYTYTLGDSQLSFLVQDNVVESITYAAITK